MKVVVVGVEMVKLGGVMDGQPRWWRLWWRGDGGNEMEMVVRWFEVAVAPRCGRGGDISGGEMDVRW
ncbi:hypothetical protein Tco_0449296 [Tanacetum coccineum]